MRAQYASLEEMLSIETMSAIEGRSVARVECEEWTPPQPVAASGCEFLRVRTVGGSRIQPYIVKRTSFATDVIRRLTNDRHCRELLVWERGILDRLPAEVESPMVACARDADGWALLMHDVSGALDALPRWTPQGLRTLSRTDGCAIIQGLAALHAHFYGDPVLCDPALHLCSGHQLFTALGPWEAARHLALPHPLLRFLSEGWEMLDRIDAPDVAAAVRALHANPRPLVDALARYPVTLVHGDPRRENVGLTGGVEQHLVLIDWQFVSAQPPVVDLAWLLNFFTPTEMSKEDIIDQYRLELAERLGLRFNFADWEPQLHLALLGQCLRTLGLKLYNAEKGDTPLIRDTFRADLNWWCEHARKGLSVLNDR
jgi:hypothetical protein